MFENHHFVVLVTVMMFEMILQLLTNLSWGALQYYHDTFVYDISRGI